MDTLEAQASVSEAGPPCETTTFASFLKQYASTSPPATTSPRRLTRSLSRTEQPNPSSALASSPPTSSPSKRKSPTASSSQVPNKKATTKRIPSTSSKPKRTSSTYAPPSKYATLTNNLTDSIFPNPIVLFIGVNPGIRTATTGHAYSHPSNLFWKLLHSSGCTPRKCTPEEDGDMPYLYALGLTNIVTRPTKDAGELSKSEMDEGVSVLEEKIKRFRPESVCFVGKSIWESVWRVRRGRQMRKEEFKYGWQGEGESIGAQADEEGGWEGAWVFVATTTSGLAAGMKPAEKEEVWKGLGEWVRKRRVERGIPDEGMAKVEEEVVGVCV